MAEPQQDSKQRRQRKKIPRFLDQTYNILEVRFSFPHNHHFYTNICLSSVESSKLLFLEKSISSNYRLEREWKILYNQRC
jgi:hypothetical protein